MSASRDPRRLLDYGGELRSVVRDALVAERESEGPDAERLRRIGERVALRVGAAAPAVAAQDGARSWFGVKGMITAIAAFAVIGFGTASFSESSHGESTGAQATRMARTPSSVVVDRRPIERSVRQMATVAAEDLPPAPVKGAAAAASPTANSNTPRSTTNTPSATSASAAAVTPEEIALLARAHEALRDRPAESLTLCREHEQRFAGGQFVQEREAVAIEALVYLGRRAEAASRWNDFKRRHPASSHNVHLASLFAEH